MDVLDVDPRVAALGVGVALVSSHQVRRVLGRGAGYVAAGAMRVGRPVVDAGRDIFGEAREVAVPHNGAGKAARARAAAREKATA